jgi:hypothetical protein
VNFPYGDYALELVYVSRYIVRLTPLGRGQCRLHMLSLSCAACQGFGLDHALQGLRPGSRSDATIAQLLLLEPDLQ